MLKKLLGSTLILVSAIGLTGCDILNSVRMGQINSDVKPAWNGAERIKLKSKFMGEKPYIYVMVDGEELLLLLDTGARFPILFDTPKVKSMNWSKGFDLALGGWGEQEDSYAYQSEAATMDLGGATFADMKVAILPISKSYYYLHPDESINDGVIGHDIMKHFTWEFDASKNEIYISRQKYQPEVNAQRLELDEFFNKIYVTGDLAFNGKHVTTQDFIVDTGSRHYVKISSAYTDNNKIELASSKVRAADFGLNGMVEHDRVVLPSLTFGDIKMEKVKVNLIPQDDEDDYWIIGNAMMNQFKTIIDYNNKAFYLVPQKEYVTDYNLFGLELRKMRGGEFIVRYVFPNLPASHLDIEVGDLVTSINGKNAADISLSEYNDIASVVGEYEVCIQRHQQCVVLKTEHIANYSDL